MLRRYSTDFVIFSVLMDIFVIGISLYISCQVRPLLNDDSTLINEINQPVILPIGLYFLFPLVWVAIMAGFGTYDSEKNVKVVSEFGTLTISSIVSAISLAGILYFSYREFSRILFLFFYLIAIVLLLFWRVLVRVFYWRRQGSPALTQKILIVGAGLVGRNFQTCIKKRDNIAYELIGFLDDDVEKRNKHKDILGGLAELNSIVIQKKVDIVVLALPRRAQESIEKIVMDLDDLPVQIMIIPDYFNLALHHAQVSEFAGMPLLNLRAPALNKYQSFTKRCFDIVLTQLILIPVLPIMAIISLGILIDSGWPIFYFQERIGENGHVFKMIKFRTMVRNAEQLQEKVAYYDEKGNYIHKKADDPRVTRIGHFLRKYSLDELPQFINVLKGEMSLVGPRPEMPYLVKKYQFWQRKRFAIPQGMTGWWQINGRSDRPMHLNTEDDIYYIQHYSIWLDIQILIRTIWVVLRGKGAY